MEEETLQDRYQRLKILADAYSTVIMAVYDGEQIEKVEPRIMREAFRKIDALAPQGEKEKRNSRSWIGLTNKSGQKIYEGDILKVKDTLWLVEPIGSLERDGQYYGLCVSVNGNGDNYFIDQSILAGEVIGNIFENPELLKGPA